MHTKTELSQSKKAFLLDRSNNNLIFSMISFEEFKFIRNIMKKNHKISNLLDLRNPDYKNTHVTSEDSTLIVEEVSKVQPDLALKLSHLMMVKDLKKIRDYYKNKYNITLHVNGETIIGQDFIKKKQDRIKKYINRYYRHPAACYLEDYFFEKVEFSSERRQFPVDEWKLILTCIPEVFHDIKKDIPFFNEETLDQIEKNIENLPEELQKKLKYNCEDYIQSIESKLDNCNVDMQTALLEVDEIQKQLGEGEIVGYIYTNGANNHGIEHYESIIITHDQIVKPVSWGENRGDGFYPPNHAVLPEFQRLLIPQADGRSCGALNLSYLKELLKDNAQQYKCDTLIFPFYRNNKKNTFFFPSPQTFRFSQSSFFNEVYLEMLSSDNDEIVVQSYTRRGAFVGPSLVKILHNSIEQARALNDQETIEINLTILNNLSSFREKWIEEYNIQKIKRFRMQKPSSGENSYLDFKNHHLTLKSREINQPDVQSKHPTVKLAVSEKSSLSIKKSIPPIDDEAPIFTPVAGVVEPIVQEILSIPSSPSIEQVFVVENEPSIERVAPNLITDTVTLTSENNIHKPWSNTLPITVAEQKVKETVGKASLAKVEKERLSPEKVEQKPFAQEKSSLNQLKDAIKNLRENNHGNEKLFINSLKALHTKLTADKDNKTEEINHLAQATTAMISDYKELKKLNDVTSAEVEDLFKNYHKQSKPSSFSKKIKSLIGLVIVSGAAALLGAGVGFILGGALGALVGGAVGLTVGASAFAIGLFATRKNSNFTATYEENINAITTEVKGIFKK